MASPFKKSFQTEAEGDERLLEIRPLPPHFSISAILKNPWPKTRKQNPKLTIQGRLVISRIATLEVVALRRALRIFNFQLQTIFVLVVAIFLSWNFHVATLSLPPLLSRRSLARPALCNPLVFLAPLADLSNFPRCATKNSAVGTCTQVSRGPKTKKNRVPSETYLAGSQDEIRDSLRVSADFDHFFFFELSLQSCQEVGCRNRRAKFSGVSRSGRKKICGLMVPIAYERCSSDPHSSGSNHRVTCFLVAIVFKLLRIEYTRGDVRSFFMDVLSLAGSTIVFIVVELIDVLEIIGWSRYGDIEPSLSGEEIRKCRFDILSVSRFVQLDI